MRILKAYEFFSLGEVKEYRKMVNTKAVQIDFEAWIETREGTLKTHPGDYIALDIHGGIYPINEKTFNQTYVPLRAKKEKTRNK